MNSKGKRTGPVKGPEPNRQKVDNADFERELEEADLEEIDIPNDFPKINFLK